MQKEPMKLSGLSSVNRGVRVLVVEDDDVDARLIESALGRDRRVEAVLRARDGDEAEALLAEGASPDLIITDLSMPKSDGLTFVKRFRQAEADAIANDPRQRRRSPLDGEPTVAPIAVLTGSDRALDYHKVVESEANTFITKPETPGQLRDVIRTLIRAVIRGETLPLLLAIEGNDEDELQMADAGVPEASSAIA